MRIYFLIFALMVSAATAAFGLERKTLYVQNATTVPSQNVAIGLADQVLGGMVVEVEGGDVSVEAMNFDIVIGVAPPVSSEDKFPDTDDITNIVMVDEKGIIVAGPIEGAAGAKNAIRFVETIIFKPGKMVYTLRGRLNDNFSAYDIVTVTTNPSSDWVTNGNVSAGDVVLNIMTVKE